MPNGRVGDQLEWYTRPHRSGDELIAEIAAGGHVLPYFAEDVVREILSFAHPHEANELAGLLESMYNAPPKPVEVVRVLKEMRDRLRREHGM
jgi:hypothetical protein